jgi:hypothetical protein
MVHNPTIAYKVLFRPPKSRFSKLVGFFDIEPLTPSGRHKLLVPNGKADSLVEADIWSPKSDQPCTVCYVGSIGTLKGASSWAHNKTIAALANKLKYLAEGNGIEVLARPTSEQGLELVKKRFQMTKLQGGDELGTIWGRHLGANGELPPQLEAVLARLRRNDPIEDD